MLIVRSYNKYVKQLLFGAAIIIIIFLNSRICGRPVKAVYQQALNSDASRRQLSNSELFHVVEMYYDCDCFY